MGYSLGIDLGTTYTAAAVCEDRPGSGGHAEIVPLGDRSPQAPSVLYKAADGSFRYGEAADRRAASEPERIAREFKRRMGDATPIFVAGTPMSAHACSKALLGWTIDQVIAGQGEDPDRVIVTCPANWGPYRRELMSQVIALNADYPITVCTEPEAAALHFASTRRVAAGQPVAVYDLGGGTFDAAVLRRTNDGGFEVLGAPAGLEQLGGVDFDEAVFERVSRGIDWDQLDPEDPEALSALARLRRDCTEAKEALSSETETAVPILLGGKLTRVRLTRAEFCELIEPLVTDTLDILERVIRRSGVAVEDLAAIVLVGGSSRIPLISERITQRFGRPAVLSPQPKLCVAMGAALLGAGPSMVNLTDAAPSAAVRSPASPVEAGLSEAGPVAVATTVPAVQGAPAADRAQTSATPVGSGDVAAASTSSTTTSTTDPAVASVAGAAANPSGAGGAGRQTSVASDNVVAGPWTDSPATKPASKTPAATGTAKQRRRPPVYRLIAAACAVLALLLAVIGPATATTGQTWNADYLVTGATPPPSDAKLNVTILGFSITRPPVGFTAGKGFDLRPSRVFLAGPVHGQLTSKKAGIQTGVLSAADRWGSGRWLSIPFGAFALAALFSCAYAESILRPIRRRKRRATAGETAGLIGSGLVMGIAVALGGWVIGDRLLETPTVLGIIFLTTVAVGLLAFVWIPNEPARK